MNEDVKSENMRIHSRADELITCLEGEIANRDEVIVGMTNSRDFWREKAIAADDELAAIKAQEPVAVIHEQHGFGWYKGKKPAPGTKLYAAPVSEVKAQGVVMPERWNVPRPMWKDARQPYGNPLNHADIEAAEKFNLALDEVVRLNAAPVQQVSAPDDMRSLAQRLREYNQNPHHINPMSEAFHILVADAANALSTACVPKEIAAAITWSEHLLFECGALTSTRAPSVHVYNKTFAAVNEARAMLAATPAAPAADAGLVEALDYQVLFDAIAAATSVYANGAVNISVQAFRDALATNSAKGVV